MTEINRRRTPESTAGVIDLGSDTCKLLIARKVADAWIGLGEYERQIRLLKYVTPDGRLDGQGIELLETVLREFYEICLHHGVNKGTVFATSFARQLKDTRPLGKIVGGVVPWPFYVLSEFEEAEWAFLGPASLGHPGSGPRIVIDVGGGSAELGLGTGRELKEWISLPFGAVRLFEQHGGELADERALKHWFEYVRESLQRAIGKSDLERWRRYSAGATVFATGATALILALMDQKRTKADDTASLTEAVLEQFDSYPLQTQRAWELLRKVIAYPPHMRRSIPGLPPERADVFPFGACVLLALVTGLEVEHIIITRRGIRYGALIASTKRQS